MMPVRQVEVSCVDQDQGAVASEHWHDVATAKQKQLHHIVCNSDAVYSADGVADMWSADHMFILPAKRSALPPPMTPTVNPLKQGRVVLHSLTQGVNAGA